jgi:hypothetical protein
MYGGYMDKKFIIREKEDETLSTPLGDFKKAEEAINFLNVEKFAKKRLGLWFKSGCAILEEREFGSPKNSKPVKCYSVKIETEGINRVAKIENEIEIKS